jgi:hypothetical protein
MIKIDRLLLMRDTWKKEDPELYFNTHRCNLRSATAQPPVVREWCEEGGRNHYRQPARLRPLQPPVWTSLQVSLSASNMALSRSVYELPVWISFQVSLSASSIDPLSRSVYQLPVWTSHKVSLSIYSMDLFPGQSISLQSEPL